MDHNINRRRCDCYRCGIDYQEDAVIEQKQQNTFIKGENL